MTLTQLIFGQYYREQQHRCNNAAFDTFKTMAQKMGKEVVIRREDQATLEDMEGVDCVVSLGADHTFLKASSLIWDHMTPILGININRDAYLGVLNDHYIDPTRRDRHVAKLLETLDYEHSVHFEKRTRIFYERIR